MLDQCHNIEPKIPAVIRSVMNVQEATAKALLVDARRWPPRSATVTCWAPTTVLMDAYSTDVRPLLRDLREDMGLDPDPVAAYKRSGYYETVKTTRVGGSAAGWGA